MFITLPRISAVRTVIFDREVTIPTKSHHVVTSLCVSFFGVEDADRRAFGFDQGWSQEQHTVQRETSRRRGLMSPAKVWRGMVSTCGLAIAIGSRSARRTWRGVRCNPCISNQDSRPAKMNFLQARPGLARSGKAREVRRGLATQGAHRTWKRACDGNRSGMAGRGRASLGAAGRGWARQLMELIVRGSTGDGNQHGMAGCGQVRRGVTR